MSSFQPIETGFSRRNVLLDDVGAAILARMPLAASGIGQWLPLKLPAHRRARANQPAGDLGHGWPLNAVFLDIIRS